MPIYHRHATIITNLRSGNVFCLDVINLSLKAAYVDGSPPYAGIIALLLFK